MTPTVKVTTFGSFMMDLVAYTDRRPGTGETLKGNSFQMALGGKGFNQAIAVSRAGASSAMLGSLGNDAFGDDFLKALREEGVDSTDVEQDEELGTGVGLPVVTADGDNSIIIMLRSNDLADDSYINRHKDRIVNSDVLLLQLELPVSGNLAAAKFARDYGIAVVLTPAPVSDIAAFKDLVDVLVPNESEAAELTGIETDLELQAQELHRELGCKNVVITLGPRGAFVSDGQSAMLISAPEVIAVDTIGAGDTLCANLCVRLASGDDLFTAARFGIYAASLKVTRKGSAMAAPTEQEVRNFMNSEEISEIA